MFTGSYVGLESAAARIRINAQLVPGFLQTEEYARAVIGRTRPTLEAGEVDRRVAARAARREALFGKEEPPEVHVVLDESAIRRRIGGRDVMRGQLASLIEAGALPNVTLQVLPFAFGAHAGVEGEFVILTFHEPEDSPVVYAEGLMGDLYLESEPELDTYQLAWTYMLEGALDPRESVAMLRELHDQL
ncbi:DUF5753 domain-containing protein [Actinomadura sp. WMMB 499]|uniref:DUF5753 domain-containing protein n=1 Tax=Actinomadura sp. WMMB 499 TaxID=1219491 RepID=UPI00124916C2|nr:DUF5753 domain-containing protein [Actinomadura sp. WMMB 499]QFG22876.1 transcriptional regulator [Actinomadura sp. WMMB 499]